MQTMMEEKASLKEKTVKGVSWGFVDNVMSAGILAVVNLVLARLLTPEQFGIVGMTSIFMTLSTSLVDSGFTGALTRKKTVDENDFNTVFYFNFMTSLLLYLILYLSAPLIADFFSQQILVPVVRVLGLSLVVTAVSIVQKVQLVRKIDFRTQAFISLAASVLSGATGIAMAVAGCGLWSLVALQLVKLVVSSVLLWAVSSWRPSFLFSFSSLREMFSFGGRLLLTAIVSTIWSEVYAIMIGRVYSASTLGQYTRAEKFRNMITSNVSIVMQKVSYPVLSSIQDEKQRQARAYRKLLRTTVLISFTAVMGLAGIAESAVIVLVGEQWIPCIPYLRILCVAGLFMPLLINSANVINANGRSDITLYLEIMKTLMALFPILMGMLFSIEALLWSTVAVSAISFLVYAKFVSRVIPYTVVEQLKDICPFLIISFVMSAIVYMVSFLPVSQLSILLIQIPVGILSVLVLCETVFKSGEYVEIKQMALKLLKGLCKKQGMQ